MTTPTTPATPTLRERLDEYLVLRRSLGFQLNDIERQVGLFCTWLEARGQAQTFIIDDAVTWARLNPDAHPSWWATRLSLVRRFAAYAHGGDPDRALSLLATWLGHSDAAHTYWYLTATGELMTLAAGMLEPTTEGEPS